MLQTQHRKVSAPALPNWSRKFDVPIPIVNGRLLFRLRDAAQFVEALPEIERDTPRWRAAAELLRMVAETGNDPKIARVGMLKALHRREPQAEFPARRRRAKSYRIIS